jgi:hypothetical protein
MPFELRLLGDSDLPALQRVYDASPEIFQQLIGRAADPELAARDFLDALRTPGRFQFGVFFDDDLIGAVDCKLDEAEEGLAHIGMLLLIAPFDDPNIRGLALRILERWLVAQFGAMRVETDVVSHAAVEIGFWLSQGYDYTGGQHRRDLPGYAPRFLVLGKNLP